MTPDLITIVTAAQQILGDQYALHVAERANEYAYSQGVCWRTMNWRSVTLGIDQARLPDGDTVSLVNRLPGPPIYVADAPAAASTDRIRARQVELRWNPYSQCSYPPEDDRIETFRTRVFDRAKSDHRQRLGEDGKVYHQRQRWH